MSTRSVTDWIAGLRAGEQEAAQQLWQRYAAQLIDLIRPRLSRSAKRVADEDDIALSVFRKICQHANEDRFLAVKDRDDLWWLLLAVTRQKINDHLRRTYSKKRRATRVIFEGSADRDSRDSAGLLLDDLIGNEPTPEFVVMLEEQQQRLLSLLDCQDLRDIAVARIAGYTLREIAKTLSIGERTVDRKIQLIREIWAKELELYNN